MKKKEGKYHIKIIDDSGFGCLTLLMIVGVICLTIKEIFTK